MSRHGRWYGGGARTRTEGGKGVSSSSIQTAIGRKFSARRTTVRGRTAIEIINEKVYFDSVGYAYRSSVVVGSGKTRA